MFLFPLSVLGAVIYERTPSGYYITSPITIDLSFDTWAETGCDEYGQNYWGVLLYETPPEWTEFLSEFVASTTKSISVEFPLEVGQEIGLITFACSIDGETLNNDGNEQEEIDGGTTAILEIVAEPEIPPITAGFEGNMPEYAIASTTAYIGDLFNSAGIWIYLFIGVPLGFFIIQWIIKEFQRIGKQEKIHKEWVDKETGRKK